MSVKHANVSIFVPHLGCPNMCSFCNQHHIACTEKVPDETDILNAVNTAKSSKNYCPETTEIAFFGGSFTAIERDLMIELLKVGYRFVADGTVSGIRISTRPDAIDDEVLDVLKKYGVTTIELGAQSMDDEVLRLNDRGHTAEDVEKASQSIKQHGFKFGLQMMTGLYGSCDELDIKTAKKLIALSPDCVRIYPTITLKNTRLCELYRAGKYVPPTLEQTVELCVKLGQMFSEVHIPIIRLGLHTIDENAYVAGPWHPAFSELCDSLVFRDKILSRMNAKGNYTASVCKQDLSKAKGQKKSNIEYFKELGYNVKIIEDNSIEKNDVLVKGCE